ncbi:DNA mismatch repair protein MutS [Burkholderia cenocepacia]|uniref:MutS-related protein n=2 Tax=Burkholderia cenocepacia TaxID=95486 RepID=UPI001AA0FC0C|nr:DNA mismatch repair protein MutS [Burkholderia cenocepacia]MBO1859138.1 DNA mismatch repair protein MutS [Burkholderia cenocepacia]MDR5645937.1 DNA mismatch repair protein MutS [Burkholderia cenocepacia]
MKAHLLYPSSDFPWDREAFWNEETLVQDLELDTLYQAMAAGDEYVYGVVRKVLPVGLVDLDDILYRQAVLADCIEHEEVVRALYDLAVEAIELERKNFYWGFSGSASSVLHGARNLVQACLDVLGKLRRVADSQTGEFRSAGFRQFFAVIREALTDDYFVTIAHCLKVLKFNDGALISAQPGKGNKGEHYVLRKPHDKEANLVKRWLAPRPPSRTFRIADRDENGARALTELEARGINHVANALAQSADHIKSFFLMLRAELAFYLGCVNLRAELVRHEIPICMPVPHSIGERRHRFVQLHDASLALRMDRPPVANDVDANGRDLIVVTGANQGGKSTFLRSLGIAQVLLQAGAFVAADAFEANVASMIVTHYKREEDASMRGGKFDEELRRMSVAVDHLAEHAIFLSNESFASTNEREGSDIGRQIVDALLESRVKIALVTHLFTLAKGLHDTGTARATFLRAERRDDGTRTFRLTEGEPLQTSFGQDLYRQIFVEPSATVEARDSRSETPSNA